MDLDKRFETLTPCQQRYVRLIAEGLDNKEIAAACGVRHTTVRNALVEVFKKMETHRWAIIAWWYKTGKDKIDEQPIS